MRETANDISVNLASERELTLCTEFENRMSDYIKSKRVLDKINLRELLISVFSDSKRDTDNFFSLNKEQKQGIPSVIEIDYNSLTQNFNLTDFSTVQE